MIGEFGWQYDASQVDDQTILAESVKRGLGYLGWSWAGNNDPILDMVPVSSWDPAQLTTWGQRIFNGTNGIRATSRKATIFGGPTTTTRSTTTTTRPTTTTTSTTTTTRSTTTTTRPTTTTTTTRPTTTTTTSGGSRACTATYSVVNQWPGGFQGEVRVTAGGAAVTGWTVTWTFANGQAVTQAWNATVTSSGSSVTARNMSYNGGLAAGGSTAFGFLGSWNGTNAAPAVSCTAS